PPEAGYGAGMDLIRSIGNAKRPSPGEQRGRTGFAVETAGTERMDRIVDDRERGAWRHDLDHRYFQPGDLVADLVHHIGGLERQQPGRFDIDARVGDPLLPQRMLDQALAECAAAHEA